MMRKILFILSLSIFQIYSSPLWSQYLRGIENDEIIIEHDGFAKNPFVQDVIMMNTDEIGRILPNHFSKKTLKSETEGYCNDQLDIIFSSPDEQSELQFIDCSYEILAKIKLFENALALKYGIKLGDDAPSILNKLSINLPVKLSSIQTLIIHDSGQGNHLEMYFKKNILIGFQFLPEVE